MEGRTETHLDKCNNGEKTDDKRDLTRLLVCVGISYFEASLTRSQICAYEIKVNTYMKHDDKTRKPEILEI